MASNSWRKRLRFHESTQRGLCRAGFLWLALLPCMLVLSYSLLSATPWYHAYQKAGWAQRISDNLGVAVTFDSIEFPSPDHCRIHQFACLDPENGTTILRAPQVSIAMDPSGWLVDLNEPELAGEQIPSSIQRLHDWFLCRPQKSARLLGLSMSELTIQHEGQQTKIRNISLGLKPTEDVTRMVLSFVCGEQDFATPVKFEVARNHAQAFPTTQWIIRTGDYALPCGLLKFGFPVLASLGTQARFQGESSWTQTHQGWIGRLQGDFHQVDLASLSSSIGSPIRGTGRLQIQSSQFTGGALDHAVGSVRSKAGSISLSWLDQSTRALGLYVDEQFAELVKKTEMASLQELGAQFQIDAQGLKLGGALPAPSPKHPMVMMAIHNTTIYGNDRFKLPLSNVIEWLTRSATLSTQDAVKSHLARSLPIHLR